MVERNKADRCLVTGRRRVHSRHRPSSTLSTPQHISAAFFTSITCHLGRPPSPCAGGSITKVASKQSIVSTNLFYDDRKRNTQESKQSINLQAKSSPSMMAPRHAQSHHDNYLHHTTVAGVLLLVCHVRQLSSLPHKLRMLENNKTTSRKRIFRGQTGVTYDNSSARPPTETLLRLSILL